MTKIEFETLRFTDKKDLIVAHFLKIFYFDIPQTELRRLGKYEVRHGKIIFESDDDRRVTRRFHRIIDRYFTKLKNKITNKPTTYIHQQSGIPLIGTNYFGLVDRGTNIIELKPMNGCNLDCIYCSVDEKQRKRDFVVEDEYLSNEFKKLVEFKLKKGCKDIEAHIAGQCEPTLYSPLKDLIKNVSRTKGVTTVSIDTNGMLLTEKKVVELINAGLTRINLSINSLDKAHAKEISGGHYDISKIKKLVQFIADRIDLIIAPVMMKGINDDDVQEIIRWVTSLKTKNKIQIGIQNFLYYKQGKKPSKERTFEDFFKILKEWEKKYSINLTKLPIVFQECSALQKPFKKGDVIDVSIRLEGRFHQEKIGIAKERCIVIPDCKKKGRIKVKLTRDKDNIFYG
jgi:hypothetical protein